MFFIILASDRPGALDRRIANRQAHIDYWAGLPDTVKVAGALLASDRDGADPKGSAFLIEAGSLDEARALVAADPFTVHGIFGDDLRIEVVRPAIGEWLVRGRE